MRFQTDDKTFSKYRRIKGEIEAQKEAGALLNVLFLASYKNNNKTSVTY
ncbi:hypothetical protein RCO48_15485 [Peribacillus frigoritolerans]|nr:hypothetical protein [Peribacillus frigoritolerans]